MSGGYSAEFLKAIKALAPAGSRLVEFGTGEGLRGLVDHFRVWAVEHDPKWIGKAAPAAYILAPIVAGWYDVSCLGYLPPVCEVLIVDGPPGRIGRSGIAQHFKSLPYPRHVVFDDTNRAPERALAVEYEKYAAGVYGGVSVRRIRNGAKQATIISIS